MTTGPQRASQGGGVQSVERTFELLELMADAGGEVALSELAEKSGLPLPTIHRIIRTLVSNGYARQQPSRRYALGPRLIRLGETASRALGSWARPYLAELTEATGETSNMAVLDGEQIVYVAQVPSQHSMRMFTEVGRRVDAHATAVGKAVMATMPPDTVTQLLSRTTMHPQTERTIVTVESMHEELARVRQQGYALDDGEQEVGVRCYAVAVPGAPAGAAISISGPEGRMTRISTDEVIPLMQRLAKDLAAELSVSNSA
ncbi:IclR family transcriptional regulator, acetate operon repressor [Saccharopolyspora antimicrobica]|uniref:IclR family transcriptional regulator n=1 Tax=Saccharopolyspora antimicrobica TaxID=455193 RepID=A0A1I5DG11_9PSEU|nr:IclR family transcriptional regulator [Saccharopolyspora antimicrobica]RKT85142.1 IclR family transcriptional regulator [Saccharopolyspora antimicrobica]SFN97741.1 IclR family transcriptional regulator, acetate operon repressor [Saccharopolyspora antimicrobica]